MIKTELAVFFVLEVMKQIDGNKVSVQVEWKRIDYHKVFKNLNLTEKRSTKHDLEIDIGMSNNSETTKKRKIQIN